MNIYSLVTEGKTPVITSFSRCGAYRVTVEKDGVKKQELITHSFNPMMLGNIIFGGVIGLVVDAGTGANCKHKEEYTIDLTSNKTSPEAAKEENKIIKPKE
ncbi:MAG: hypothetical protein RLZZ210_651 [Pseudomonadota bacterium]